ncbi:hypothetical protein pb186bvf_004584 [Paramecium bursaria]
MSNLTFSGIRSLQSNDQIMPPVPMGLQKYQNILEKYSNTQEFDEELERKLLSLESDNRHTYAEKSSLLNRQYESYVQDKDIQLSNMKMVELKNDDIITNKETQQFLSTFKSNSIKFNQFFQQLLKQYNIQFDNEFQRTLFQNNLKQRLLTIDPDYISINALELSTRDKGVTGLLEEIIDIVEEECQNEKKVQLNNQIVLEFEHIKQMLDKKSIMLAQKEKDLQFKSIEIQKTKSELCQNLQQVYEILSKMMEENYNNKLQLINKKYLTLESQLKSKIKIIESKSQLINKSNNNQTSELQKLKLKSSQCEKQIESLKLKIIDLEKKITQEKEQSSQYQLKIQKLQQKVQSLKVDAKEPSISQSEESLKPIQEIKQEKQEQIIPISAQNQKQQKTYQQLIQQILKPFINDTANILQIDFSDWYGKLIPKIYESSLEDIIQNISSLIQMKQGFSQIFEFILCLSQTYHYNQQIKTVDVESMNQKKQKQYKHYYQLKDYKNLEFGQNLKYFIDKKKKGKSDLAFIGLIFEQKSLQYYIDILLEETLDEQTAQQLIDKGIVQTIFVRLFDESNVIEILLNILTLSNNLEVQIINQVIQYNDQLILMLQTNNNDFCEKLSIIVQRLFYHNPFKLNQNQRQIIQKKIQQAKGCQLLESNLNYILNN